MAKLDGLDRLLDDAQAGPLTALLVKADRTSDEIGTYRIDRSTASLLHRFAEPKPYAQFRDEAAASIRCHGRTGRGGRFGLCAKRCNGNLFQREPHQIISASNNNNFY